ncbi:unnamed protein product, partial [Prorocentrum cordatum]
MSPREPPLRGAAAERAAADNLVKKLLGQIDVLRKEAWVAAQAGPRLGSGVPSATPASEGQCHAEVGGLQRDTDVEMLAAPSAPSQPAVLCREALPFFPGAGAHQFRGGTCDVDDLLEVLVPAVKYPACRVHPPAADGSEGGGTALPHESEAQLTKQMDEVKPNSSVLPASACEDHLMFTESECNAKAGGLLAKAQTGEPLDKL